MKPNRKLLPPIWLLIFMVAIFLVDRWLPLFEFPAAPRWVGKGLTAMGVLIIAWPVLAFARARTGVVPFSPATTLVTTGLFRWSRNPMYLGMTLILLGGALHLGSLGALLLVPLYPLVIQQRFILPEERFLEEAFGEEYLAYCGRVRRWI